MLALTTCCLMTLAMGTLHAWSVLSASLEQTLSLSRAGSSLVYSIALVSLTLTVLCAAPLFDKLKPWVLFATASAMAGVGLLIAASGNAAALYVGYGLIFGIANGAGYGFALQLSARVYPHRSGFAMGITTASYALGATLGAQILGLLVANHDALFTVRLHGYSFLLLAPVLAVLIAKSNARYIDKTQQPDSASNRPFDNGSAPPTSNHIDKALINRYRISYGLSVFAGLMAMAHAVPFISSFQTAAAAPNALNVALLGAVVLGVGNATGGVIAGLASDKLNPVAIVTALPAIAAAALAAAAMASTLAVSLSALTIIGFTYGALIAVYPVAIARQFGPAASAGAYGQVFIAWGAAGLLAPVVAGALYDATRSYQYPMLLALCLSLFATAAARRLCD